MSTDVNLEAPEFSASLENPRDARRAMRPGPKPKGRQDLEEVQIVCITDVQPWTHEGPLQRGEKAMVPKWLADTMVINQHAVII